MRLRRLHRQEYDWTAASEVSGELFVDDAGFVRFVSHEEVGEMRGVGHYSGASGYEVYEDGPKSEPIVATDHSGDEVERLATDGVQAVKRQVG